MFIRDVFNVFHFFACVILQMFVSKVNFEVASKLSLDIAQLRPVWLRSFRPKSKTARKLWVLGVGNRVSCYVIPQFLQTQSFFVTFARSCLRDKHGQTQLEFHQSAPNNSFTKNSKHVDIKMLQFRVTFDSPYGSKYLLRRYFNPQIVPCAFQAADPWIHRVYQYHMVFWNESRTEAEKGCICPGRWMVTLPET